MSVVSSIAEYISEINKIRAEFGSDQLVFRGQGNSEWKIQSTLERSGANIVSCAKYYRDVDYLKPEINSLGYNFERKNIQNGYDFDFTVYDNVIKGPPPDIKYLSYLRHHGFPTPLIDVTQSEYVALFFACESIGLKKADGSYANASVFVFSKRLSSFASEELPILKKIGHCFETDKRHIAQQSEYVIPMQYLKKEISEWHFVPFQHFQRLEPLNESSVYGSVYIDSLFIRNVEIVGEAKKNIMAELARMNINHYTLYLSEDALIQKLKYEYLRRIEQT